jgi:ATP-dependent DNA helicase RecG
LLPCRPAENEVVEFKEAKNGYDFTKLGKYFSALCNEANLKGANGGMAGVWRE